jgi:hypothetical protein
MELIAEPEPSTKVVIVNGTSKILPGYNETRHQTRPYPNSFAFAWPVSRQPCTTIVTCRPSA